MAVKELIDCELVNSKLFTVSAGFQFFSFYMHRNVRKRTLGHVRVFWSESSLDAFWIAKADLSLRWAHLSEGTFSHVATHLKMRSTYSTF